MSNNLFLTLVIAFVLIVLAIAALAVGWLITGKSRISPGCCGKDPTKKRDDKECEDKGSCDLCKPEKDSNTDTQVYKDVMKK